MGFFWDSKKEQAEFAIDHDLMMQRHAYECAREMVEKEGDVRAKLSEVFLSAEIEARGLLDDSDAVEAATLRSIRYAECLMEKLDARDRERQNEAMAEVSSRYREKL